MAHEPLGTLNPLLKAAGLRVKYVNFDRDPNLVPQLEDYNGLVVLGGGMGVYEADKHPHLKVEMKLIEEALKKNIPVLGICLGSQLIAQVLGSTVRKHTCKEIGWFKLYLTSAGKVDPVFKDYNPTESVFQWHGDTFDIPKSATHLASSDLCESQAFRYGEKVIGLQFHLEVDEAMILRWLKLPNNLKEIAEIGVQPEDVQTDTHSLITRSLELSHSSFSKFVDLFGFQKTNPVGSGHGKPRR